MQLFLECEIRGVIPRKPYTDPVTGEVDLSKKKYRTALESESGERLEVNSSHDYTEFVKKGQGVAKLNVFPNTEGGGFYLTLDEFVPQTIE